MKILGISFGKKNANTDILVKEALFGCREAAPDAQISFINTCSLNIGRCRGCGACSTALEKGKNDNVCIFKDDFQALEEQVREADCLIVGAPVYVLQPVGQFKDFVDRFSCRHDYSAITWIMDKRRNGEMPGDPDGFPMERLKKRTVSYISVGGATTDNWTSMGTATLHFFGFPPMMKVMGNYNANSMGTVGNPLLDDQMISDMHEMGRRTVEGYNDDSAEFFQPSSKPAGVCPVCHQRLITVNPGTTTVECPVCGIEGKLRIENDEIKVDFSEEQQARARGTFAGLREHTTEIQSFGSICGPKIMANKEKLDKLMKERIKGFDTAINNK
ncbi:flavodoxin family protein [Murimonas intestini]|uniref:flavodoxin family protein n=1 Tax=Murimonas intestini TaxID=1337051 RepID=UPI0011DD8F0C|nr:flavodoxin family protein [Murimonas intestini]